MKKSLISLALLALIGTAAHATKCDDGLDYSAHPEGRCDWYYQGTDPTIPKGGSPATATSNSAAGALAGAGAAAGVDSRIIVDASGAPVSAQQLQEQRQQQQAIGQGGAAAGGTGVGGAGGGLSGTIGVNGGTTNYNNSTRVTTLYLPPLPMGPALPPMQSSDTKAITTACTPQKIVYREPVVVLVRNSFGPDYMAQVGWDESLRDAKEDFKIKKVPVAYDVNGAIIYRDVPYGTQAVIKSELMNAASGTSFAFGGLGKSAGAQVGGMDQGAVQRWVSAIHVFECPLDLAPAVVTKEKLVETERKAIRQ